MSTQGSHPCFMPSCDRIAAAEWAVCGACWRVLPRSMRASIARSYVVGMTLENRTPGMLIALSAARSWVLEAFGNVTRDKHDPSRWERLKRYVREKDAARIAARAAGVPLRPRPRCPSAACPCTECVDEYGAITGVLGPALVR